MGENELNRKMIAAAVEYVKCIAKHDVDTFNELCFVVYQEKDFQFDIERFPPTLDSIKHDIKRAYLQCYRWRHEIN